MELNKIWNESNEITMREHIDPHSVDVIITSPPYNNSRDNKDRTNMIDGHCKSANIGQYKDQNGNYIGIGGYHKKYDVYEDYKTTQEYCDWIVSIFNQFDTILKENGTVLWNTSYQAEDNDGACWLVLGDVLRKTNFTIVDHMIWKKKCAIPVSQKNKLSHLCEDVFIFARKNEFTSFNMNKVYSSTSRTGQKFYKPVMNLVEADNNDEICPYNKATFSTEFVRKMLSYYVCKDERGGLVYDPFMGSGTTALACQQMGINFIGSELSENQVDWANNRLRFGKGYSSSDVLMNDRALF